jgi:hypothetical protein
MEIVLENTMLIYIDTHCRNRIFKNRYGSDGMVTSIKNE